MRRLLVALTFVLITVPGFAEAKTTVWNMEGVTKLEGWNHKGFSNIGLTEDGLSMSTPGDGQGQLARAGNVRHDVDTVAVTYTSAFGANGIFFWQTKDMQGNQAYNIPISFDASAAPTTMALDLSRIPEWDPNSKLIGFNINQNSQLTLHRVELTGPGWTDSILYPLKSFFTYDRVHAYTVNFLWGPRMVYTQEHVAQVFSKVPPLGDSWNGRLYWIIGLAALAAFAARLVTGKSYTILVVALCAALWVTLDLRMGAEIISYANTDYKTWWSKPIELKDFRDRGSFTAFTKVAQEYLQDSDETYALITPSGWPYFGAMAYETYPATPLSASDDLSTVSLWLVFDMPNVGLDDQNRITKDGEPISPPGEVLLQYEPGAFIFRVTQ